MTTRTGAMGSTLWAVLTCPSLHKVERTVHADRRCTAGKRWVFRPNIPPFTADKLDPAYLMQVQLQQHAAGATKGYLVSWARTGLAVFEVPYDYEFVVSLARVLSLVIPAYIEPEERPALPQRWADLTAEMQEQVVELYTAHGSVVASCTQISIPGVLYCLLQSCHRNVHKRDVACWAAPHRSRCLQITNTRCTQCNIRCGCLVGARSTPRLPPLTTFQQRYQASLRVCVLLLSRHCGIVFHVHPP